MYQALYRKWRPRSFDEVVGQEHITEILKKQVLTDRPSHAYLFTGTRGTGKTTCAKLLAKAVNCLNPVGGNPCGVCEICRGIDSGSILDVTEMDAASNNGVDDVRAIRDEAVYAPVAARRRVYIIDEVHMLSKPAFNALLKLMEEPPELIRRRLLQVAEAEGMELTEDAAGLLSRLADGALRDALSLLDQCAGARIDRERVLSAIGLAENEEICRMLAALLRGDADTALTILDELYRGGKDVSALLGQLASLYRDILLGRVAPKNGGGLMSGGFAEGDLARLSAVAGTETLLRGLDLVQTASAQLDRSSDRRLAAELCLVRIAALGGLDVGNAFVPAPPVAPEFRPAPEARPAAPEPQPVPKSAPVSAKDAPLSIPELKRPEPPQEAPSGGVTWEKILAKLEESLFIADYMLLSNPENLSGSLDGDALTLCPKNDMVREMLDPGRLEEIRAAAMALTGGTVAVKLENSSGKSENRFEKVDQLFGKFNFGN